MVQLGRIPSEFDVARMRDSFLRQFLEQGGCAADATPTAAGNSSKDVPVMIQTPGGMTQTPGGPTGGDPAGKAQHHDVPPVLTSTQPKSLSSPLARHLAVAEIVR